jgi:hypothetical protein
MFNAREINKILVFKIIADPFHAYNNKSPAVPNLRRAETLHPPPGKTLQGGENGKA